MPDSGPKGPSIVWLRDDLRLADNPALAAGVERGEPVVVVYLLDEVSRGIRPLGGAARWWLHHSLESLAVSIGALGGSLVLRRGAAEVEIPRLVEETGAGAVYWNRRYGAAREVDTALKTCLREQGVEVSSFQATLLFEPWTVTTGDGNPYRVFTPFWQACLTLGVQRRALPAPTSLPSIDLRTMDVASDELGEWQLLPTHPDWADGLRESQSPGETNAMARLEEFVDDGLDHYGRRDFPGEDATSRLSPYLRFGEIGPLQIWERMSGEMSPAALTASAGFLREIGWREFNWNILFHMPDLHERNFRASFDSFPWEQPRAAELEAWQQGRTGIPLVDAGMRELWRTGTMHNRVRMVTASLLIKNLLIDWRVGEAWFWDTLVDADEASNPANWQWVAGSGADAAPYFRVFNPQLQAEKFDKQQRYIRRWVPEVGTADYPESIVDLKQSRTDALSAYEHMKASTS